MKRSWLFFLASLLFQSAIAQTFEAGKSYFDAEGWNGFMVGDIPLIISAPHGGTINLDEVEDRDCEGAVTVTDTYTKELAIQISETMYKYYQKRPYLIICNLIRKDIDQNRALDEATCGSELMIKPWNVFHNYIDTAIAMATRKFGGCIYIDLHGHGHSKQRLEIGYLLKDADLKEIAQHPTMANAYFKKSSLTNVAPFANDSMFLYNLIMGPNAFGTLMANEGFPSVPSMQDPYPLEGDKFFNGGYNTKRYNSEKYPHVFGWQIETNYKGVRDPSGRIAFANSFCKIIYGLLKEIPAKQIITNLD